MKKTVALMDKLLRLAHGEALPASSLKGEWFERMAAEGILVAIVHGSHKSLRARDERSFREFLAGQYELRNLEACRDLLAQGGADRATQVNLTGDSKFVSRRTFCGFLVHSFQPIPAMLNGTPMTILPQDGSFVFVYDYRDFVIPEDVVVIGIENPENFRHVAAQKRLFESAVPDGARMLFVSRYPQGQTKDLVHWLQSIPNRYVHWGDLDLAGIHIYLSEFYKHLGKRASLLIPADYESRIAWGSRERYEKQFARFGKLECGDPRIKEVLDCIHRHHRGYDQEGYIKDGVCLQPKPDVES